MLAWQSKCETNLRTWLINLLFFFFNKDSPALDVNDKDFFKEFQKKFKFVSSVYIANVKRDWLRNRWKIYF